MPGNELPVPETCGIAQVGVVIAADELHEGLDHYEATGAAVAGRYRQAKMPAGGGSCPDLPEVFAAQARLDVAAHGVTAEQVDQVVLEAAHRSEICDHGPDEGRLKRDQPIGRTSLRVHGHGRPAFRTRAGTP
jgi:hypothetical protein